MEAVSIFAKHSMTMGRRTWPECCGSITSAALQGRCAPTMAGEANDSPGYAMPGKVFAVGYRKGMMKALGIPYE